MLDLMFIITGLVVGIPIAICTFLVAYEYVVDLIQSMK